MGEAAPANTQGQPPKASPSLLPVHSEKEQSKTEARMEGKQKGGRQKQYRQVTQETSSPEWGRALGAEVKSLSRVRLFATPWTVAYHTPPSTGFSRREHWSGSPFPSHGLKKDNQACDEISPSQYSPANTQMHQIKTYRRCKNSLPTDHHYKKCFKMPLRQKKKQMGIWFYSKK